MPSSADKANLARIRDNQRRSRARRKEYLQDLENQVRNCKLMGVEASAEIQNAARKVSIENKQLRLLLKQKGITEDELNIYMAGNNHDVFHSDGPVLDILLQTRKACDGSSDSSKCKTVGIEDSKFEEVDTYQPGLDDYTHLMQHPSLLQANMDGRPPGPGIFMIQEHQSPLLHGQPLDPESVMSHPFADPEYRINPVPGEDDSMSCAEAANLVVALDPRINREELAMDLGCAPGSACTVENTTVFGVMDKYTADGLGI